MAHAKLEENDDDTDEALMERVGQGDRQAFAVLFERHHASLVRYAHRFMGEPARAEEAAQEIFIKLYQSSGQYRVRARFKTFLFRVATNHCLNEARKARRWWWRSSAASGQQSSEAESSVESLADARLPGADRPDDLVEGRELEQVVNRALLKMSARERAAFSMCRFEGLSYREIAEAMGTSESAVKSLIHRATAAVTEGIERSRV